MYAHIYIVCCLIRAGPRAGFAGLKGLGGVIFCFPKAGEAGTPALGKPITEMYSEASQIFGGHTNRPAHYVRATAETRRHNHVEATVWPVFPKRQWRLTTLASARRKCEPYGCFAKGIIDCELLWVQRTSSRRAMGRKTAQTSGMLLSAWRFPHDAMSRKKENTKKYSAKRLPRRSD